jgi:hypothetical protein
VSFAGARAARDQREALVNRDQRGQLLQPLCRRRATLIRKQPLQAVRERRSIGRQEAESAFAQARCQLFLISPVAVQVEPRGAVEHQEPRIVSRADCARALQRAEPGVECWQRDVRHGFVVRVSQRGS